MKLRAWLALVLFVHLLGHPLVHGLTSVNPPARQATVSGSRAAPQATTPIEDCLLCRHSAALEMTSHVVFLPEQHVLGSIHPAPIAQVPLLWQQEIAARGPPIL